MNKPTNENNSVSMEPESTKFQNTYRIESARLQNWDYGSNALYFITICTKNRNHYFGKIQHDNNNGLDRNKLILSDMGLLAEKYWAEIPDHFPFINLDSFVIMPNHVHGILRIDKVTKSSVPNLINGGITRNKNPMFHDNISRIIRWYKGRCTFELRKINLDFG